jgi:hypothetical protein
MDGWFTVDCVEDEMRRYLFWLPFLLVLFWCGKNAWYFGVFGMSSWGPLSQYKMCLYELPQATRDSLATVTYTGEGGSGRGRISPYSTQEPFARLWRYGVPSVTPDSLRTQFYPHTPHRFIAVLDQSQFTENGSNLNHWLYLRIAAAQKNDNRWAINQYPGVYWRTVWRAMRISLKPASTWFEVGGNHPERQRNLNVMREVLGQ